MRPVRRGPSPQDHPFSDYKKARPHLVSRLGPYCSYCERRLSHMINVEHVVPKGGSHGQPGLIGTWSNFLLACVNCNATKGSKEINFSRLFFPDRDNTFLAFRYREDGIVISSPNLRDESQRIAADTLKLVGLDGPFQEYRDENDRLVALDRAAQRMEAWSQAEVARDNLAIKNTSRMRDMIVKLAVQTGFFSVWMAVFDNNSVMRKQLIDAFPGTRGSGCFDADSLGASPAPNPDNLEHGAKV